MAPSSAEMRGTWRFGGAADDGAFCGGIVEHGPNVKSYSGGWNGRLSPRSPNLLSDLVLGAFVQVWTAFLARGHWPKALHIIMTVFLAKPKGGHAAGGPGAGPGKGGDQMAQTQGGPQMVGYAPAWDLDSDQGLTNWARCLGYVCLRRGGTCDYDARVCF